MGSRRGFVEEVTSHVEAVRGVGETLLVGQRPVHVKFVSPQLIVSAYHKLGYVWAADFDILGGRKVEATVFVQS